MLLKEFTQKQQSELASYCRTNELADDLQVRKERVHHYRRLVFNVINDSLQSAFPLALNLIGENEWTHLANHFFSDYKPQSPQVWKMPGEFCNWFFETQQPFRNKFPFINDLLLFEWKEVELYMMDDIPYEDYIAEGSWLQSRLVINPEHAILPVSWPVHLKKAKTIEETDKGQFYILMFRERESGRIQFMDISAIYVLIIENLLAGNNLLDILDAVHNQLPDISRPEMEKSSIAFLQKLTEKGFIYGFYA